jgi:hypothetical protein
MNNVFVNGLAVSPFMVKLRAKKPNRKNVHIGIKMNNGLIVGLNFIFKVEPELSGRILAISLIWKKLSFLKMIILKPSEVKLPVKMLFAKSPTFCESFVDTSSLISEIVKSVL